MSETVIKLALNKILFALIGRHDLVEEWWHSPNRAFDMRTPDEVYQSGMEGRMAVKQYLMDQVAR
jgi:hypothetical protein